MTIPPIFETFLTLIAGIAGGGFGIAILNRKKTKAETKGIETNSSLLTVDRVLAFNQDLLKRVEKLEEQVEEDRRREDLLEGRISALGGSVAKLERENVRLRDRCENLETENASLKQIVADQT